VFCQPRDAAGTVKTPCQKGYGNCAVIPPPNCGGHSASASNGRKVAYYQTANVRYRACNRIQPSQIVTNGLTHLILTFAAIDPVSFKVTPTDPSDTVLYSQFTSLKTPQLQTWISIGGFDFNNPGPTFTTWSDMCTSATNRASFIASLIEFMDTWGFQGVDIDWEYPTIAARGGRPGDTANLCSLLEEMRAAFGTKYGISIVL
jgi:chitinase